MEQLEFFSVPSPCIGVCSVDDRGYCQGCMRKREERFNWLSFTPAQQRHIIKLCRQRYRRKMAAKKAETNKETIPVNTPQQALF
ncbi:DUF1289 domain-containing protein [Vibrio hippocampi]|uniref:DUF1289 domain-containing protein n=1 Tax=Vibrio hippocampi TaxID=654686 RepID=A0ABM8ZHJ5_9VIBR|nr:DUF1289 domain-containing protein [Vibrio hippocampi]CAH0526145.1 hypothetical protein VHP8226_01619 [Vibrio hippocampi]